LKEHGKERRSAMSKRWLVPVGLAAAALIATGCGSSSSSTSAGSGGSNGGHSGTVSSNTVTTSKIGGTAVLANAKGFALYWFVPDTSTKSNCNGQCATFWPPVKGPVSAGSGVTGTLGTITRADGSTQATWNGHPLYTYKADTKPGEDTGNGLNASGGVWHVVTLTNAPAPASKKSSSSSGGGYGY
jgi:predicted lipoprotein with Yx(FWY)xxD motif